MPAVYINHFGMWRMIYFSLALDLSYPVLISVLHHLRDLRNLMEERLCAIAKMPDYIRRIPDFLQNSAFYLRAIRTNVDILGYISKEFMTPEMYLEVAISNSRIAIYIPEHLLTQEFCTELVEHNVLTVKYISQHCKLPHHILLCALKEDTRIINDIPYDAELFMLAVKQDGMILGHIRPEFITREMCFEAIANNPRASRYVPEKFGFKK
jgi:hypothetical protein